jgi:hypothetical protein
MLMQIEEWDESQCHVTAAEAGPKVGAVTGHCEISDAEIKKAMNRRTAG